MSRDVKCEACFHSMEVQKTFNDGVVHDYHLECRVNPPVGEWQKGEFKGIWPVVDEYDLCGKFKKIKTERE